MKSNQGKARLVILGAAWTMHPFEHDFTFVSKGEVVVVLSRSQGTADAIESARRTSNRPSHGERQPLPAIT